MTEINNSYNVGFNSVNNTTQHVNQQSANSGNSKPTYTLNDGYSSNPNVQNKARVPNVDVGLLDKMGAYKDGVLQTTENLKNYVAFKNDVDKNPNSFLKSGSPDATTVRDLQTKLRYVGLNVNVNGNFGSSTEKAVIEFKKSVGINDGYLTKDGEYAVTSIVTPQTWNVLNSKIGARLNPNTTENNYSGTFAPVSQNELTWAKNLQSKIINMGYKPTPQERQQYDEIQKRQKMSVDGSSNTRPTEPPTQQEMQWAKELVKKITQFSYKPSTQEQQQYHDIQNRQQMAKYNNLYGNTNTQQTQNTQQNNSNVGASQQEVDWATNLMNKIKTQGYRPTAQEQSKYNEIYAKTRPSSVSSTQGSGNGVSQQEMQWAKNLEAKVKNGYQASPQEKQQYNEIFAKYKANGGEVVSNSSGRPSDDELAWAYSVEERYKKGEQLSTQEIGKYNDIATRLQTYMQSQKSSEGSSNVTGKSHNTHASSGVSNTSSVDNSDPSVGAFLEAFKGSKIVYGGVPYLNKADALNVAKQFGFNSVEALQSSVGAKVDGKFGPETYSKLMQASNGGASQGTSGNMPAKPSDEEIAWAQQIEAKYQGGQKLTDQEISKYNDIATRLQTYLDAQNSQKPANGVTQSEFDWATQLSNKIQQGYKATSEEQAKYQEIFNRYSQGGIVSANTQTPANGASQAEYDWASQLSGKIQQGYKPTAQEISKYQDIQNRFVQGGIIVEPKIGATPSEFTWANQLASKIQQGYKPTAQEVSKYQDIQARFVQGGIINEQSNAGVSQTEFDWATQLATKVQQGYKATPQEQAKYQDIQARFTQYGVASPQQGQSAGVSQEELTWATQLVTKIQQGYKATNEELAKYEDIYNRQANSSSQTNNVVSTTGGATQEELNWAIELENKVKQGYKPSQDEVNKYNDVYTRYANANSASNNTSVSGTSSTNNTPLTQGELTWAQNLQTRRQNGYQATQQEIAKYQDIYSRYQSQVINPTSTTSSTSNVGNVASTGATNTVYVNTANADANLQWALQLLDKIVQQGYIPTEDESKKYEAIIAKQQTVVANP